MNLSWLVREVPLFMPVIVFYIVLRLSTLRLPNKLATILRIIMTSVFVSIFSMTALPVYAKTFSYGSLWSAILVGATIGLVLDLLWKNKQYDLSEKASYARKHLWANPTYSRKHLKTLSEFKCALKDNAFQRSLLMAGTQSAGWTLLFLGTVTLLPTFQHLAKLPTMSFLLIGLSCINFLLLGLGSILVIGTKFIIQDNPYWPEHNL